VADSLADAILTCLRTALKQFSEDPLELVFIIISGIFDVAEKHHALDDFHAPREKAEMNSPV
jgi:hypothetical protein